MSSFGVKSFDVGLNTTGFSRYKATGRESIVHPLSVELKPRKVGVGLSVEEVLLQHPHLTRVDVLAVLTTRLNV